ncbi:MAG: bifunctional diaminohydroxyphosphoribosylaminopyrimidine deaminase/5-amino-6-(5-phosphoribosylamino)uracil reductase RibD [Rhodospirillaceae bacterium]|nr:bifunctional diaminohydroxyphosphoribosylaminopyrimidine deaminase/5-amino-6-(5-phosphoribosylamino)uracil reductase RibD [Rhodospirillaceae bacterium]
MTTTEHSGTQKSEATDIRFMRGALALAQRGLGNVWPNPAVGCVIVNNGHVVGRGWTQPGGRPHAETEALKRAGSAARGATAYVTLEPCAHFGKTPPCADALVNAGIKRAVIATVDPDPRTAGQGIQKLKEGGIDVSEGVLETDAKKINAGFFNLIKNNKPIFALKVAASSDGCIAAGPGKKTDITGTIAKNMGHMLRASHDMVLFGIGTLLVDDPQYTCRLPGMESRTPIRALLDSNLRIPLDARILQTLDKNELWIFCTPNADMKKQSELEDLGVKVITVEKLDANAKPDLGWIASYLGKNGISRVLVEAGSNINQAFINAKMVDCIHWFASPINLDQEQEVGAILAFNESTLAKDVLNGNIQGFQMTDRRTCGEDTYMVFEKNKKG